MRKFWTIAGLAALAFASVAFPARAGDGKSSTTQQSVESDPDQTLHAMHDELERSRTRLQIPGVEKPFYIEYRLLDLDIRNVTASSGALPKARKLRILSNTSEKLMTIDVARVKAIAARKTPRVWSRPMCS